MQDKYKQRLSKKQHKSTFDPDFEGSQMPKELSHRSHEVAAEKVDGKRSSLVSKAKLDKRSKTDLFVGEVNLNKARSEKNSNLSEPSQVLNE